MAKANIEIFCNNCGSKMQVRDRIGANYCVCSIVCLHEIQLKDACYILNKDYVKKEPA